ncbi:cysteine hydrolase family protein [Paenibacillus alba]|uniref:Cysteine hydrolase n=1 Tax=Paenibacillus alba TaxID=1197127 RepID=A0ABU6GB44_9BACL|nr:cysteine hydrolase [Paenibacillus alba]MEC0229944.1 cysteine hydrolase [Paenibacillus alba]
MLNQSNHTALLLMDVQNAITSRFAERSEALVPFQKALETARGSGIQVIFVRLAFRDGHSEISPRNKSFSRISETGMGAMGPTDAATQIHSSLEPKPGEPIVTKLRVSAFAGSDLEIILRSRQINTLVLGGIATSGVVLSTLREAADKDFALTVLSDACLDADPEVHRVLIEKVFPRQAEVMTVAAWAETLD